MLQMALPTYVLQTTYLLWLTCLSITKQKERGAGPSDNIAQSTRYHYRVKSTKLMVNVNVLNFLSPLQPLHCRGGRPWEVGRTEINKVVQGRPTKTATNTALLLGVWTT